RRRDEPAATTRLRVPSLYLALPPVPPQCPWFDLGGVRCPVCPSSGAAERSRALPAGTRRAWAGTGRARAGPGGPGRAPAVVVARLGVPQHAYRFNDHGGAR